MPKRAKSYTQWKKTADSVMLRTYGIDTNDAGIDDERLKDHWATGELPERFVEWFAQKYDLISKREVGIEGW